MEKIGWVKSFFEEVFPSFHLLCYYYGRVIRSELCIPVKTGGGGGIKVTIVLSWLVPEAAARQVSFLGSGQGFLTGDIRNGEPDALCAEHFVCPSVVPLKLYILLLWRSVAFSWTVCPGAGTVSCSPSCPDYFSWYVTCHWHSII